MFKRDYASFPAFGAKIATLPLPPSNMHETLRSIPSSTKKKKSKNGRKKRQEEYLPNNHQITNKVLMKFKVSNGEKKEDFLGGKKIT